MRKTAGIDLRSQVPREHHDVELDWVQLVLREEIGKFRATNPFAEPLELLSRMVVNSNLPVLGRASQRHWGAERFLQRPGQRAEIPCCLLKAWSSPSA
jgi:hypothetical protein